jgi:hypothetical protein
MQARRGLSRAAADLLDDRVVRWFSGLGGMTANVRPGKMATPITPITFKRIEALFDIEREIKWPVRCRVPGRRKEMSVPLVAALEDGPSAPGSRATPQSRRRSTTCRRVCRPSLAPRTRPRLPQHQRRRLGARQEVMAVCGIGARSRTNSADVHAHRRLGSPTSSPASPTRHRQTSVTCFRASGATLLKRR